MDAQCGLLHVYTACLREDLKWILNNNHVLTERELLRVVMSLFDLLGLAFLVLIQEILGLWSRLGRTDQWKQLSAMVNSTVLLLHEEPLFPVTKIA